MKLRMKRAILFSTAILVSSGCANSREQGGFARHPELKSSSSGSGRRGKASVPPRILPQTHYAAGRVFEQQGSPEKAIEQYRKAIAVNHEFPEAYARLGLMLSVTGQHEEATVAFEKAVAMKPETAVLRNNLGFELLYVERWDDAEGHLREAVRLDPKFTHAHINLGLLLGRKQRDEEAVESFRKALPEPDAYYNVGLLQRAQGRYAQSAESFRKVLALNPEFPAAQRQLTFIEQKIAAISKPQQPAVAENIVEPKLNADEAQSIIDLGTLIDDLITKPKAAQTQSAVVPTETKVVESANPRLDALVRPTPAENPSTNKVATTSAVEPASAPAKPADSIEKIEKQEAAPAPAIAEKQAFTQPTQPIQWDLNLAEMARALNAADSQRNGIAEIKNLSTPPVPVFPAGEQSENVVTGPPEQSSDEVVLVAAETQTRTPSPEPEFVPPPAPSPVRLESWQMMEDMETSLQILRNEVQCQKEHGMIQETLNDSGMDLQHDAEWTPVRTHPDPAQGTMLWDTQFKALDDWITYVQSQTLRAGNSTLAQKQSERNPQGKSVEPYEYSPALYTPPVTAPRRVRPAAKESQHSQPAESQPRD